MRTIDKIIIHCAATKEGVNIGADTIRNWHIWPKDYKEGKHTYVKYLGETYQSRDELPEAVKNKNGRGWSDIGYHYIILLDGKVKEGRREKRSGAHTKGQNFNSIGVCYVGGVDKDLKAKDTRTPEQKESLVNLVKKLKEKYPKATIHGHNEFANKACPSFDVKKEFNN